MQGEAVLGLEAAARSLVRPGMPVLNLVSGVFGKGMGYWLKRLRCRAPRARGAVQRRRRSRRGRPLPDEHPGIGLVTVVHSETPSGTLNPVEEIGPIAKRHGALVLVDCVSSLGGIPIWPDEWQLDVCVAGPQKCLAGPPGMSLMTVSEDAWDAIRANPAAPRSSFLSMLDWKEQWLEAGRFPFTPSVVDLHGVEAACDVILEEGLEASFARHERAPPRAGRACGRWASTSGRRAGDHRRLPTALAVPESLTDIQVRDHCRARYGVMLSAGQGAGNLVRIGHMGRPPARSTRSSASPPWGGRCSTSACRSGRRRARGGPPMLSRRGRPVA